MNDRVTTKAKRNGILISESESKNGFWEYFPNGQYALASSRHLNVDSTVIRGRYRACLVHSTHTPIVGAWGWVVPGWGFADSS